jgi:LuxR family transcriptional regulator, maltose regulon positive regulatory protein
MKVQATSHASHQLPRERRSLVQRPRLLARLHAAIGSGLTVLHAPAGFGKTALLTQFAADVEFEARWLSLDDACAVPEVFAERVAAALLPGSGYAAPSAVGRTGDLKAYLAAAAAEASQGSELPVLLVLDNVHVIGDEATVDLLGWLIEAAPTGTEVVLSGRALPALADLDERIASGDVVLLGSAELAFDESEIAAACAARRSAMAPAAVLESTAGWPVGVMASLAGTLRADSSLQRQQAAAWDRYLATQVWESVPADLRPALLRLAVLPSIEPRAAGRTVGPKVWRELSDWLSRHDFLYETLDGECIRLNPLLRSFLFEEYQATEPGVFDEAVGELIDRAERAGEIASAMELARSPGQESRLAAIVERSGTRLIQQGAFALLRRALDALPRETVECTPMLAAVRARVLAHTHRPTEALSVADRLLSDPEVRDCARIHATLARIRALRLLGKHDELNEWLDKVRAIGGCDDQAVLGELTYTEGEIALSVLSDFPRAERLLRQTVEQCEAAGIEPLGLLATSTLGQLLTMKGDAPGAVDMLTKAARGWRGVGRSSNLGWVLNNLGMAHLGVGDFESAIRVLEESRAEGIQCENQRNAAYAIASLGDAELALGHWQKAREQYEEAIRICAEDAPDETLAALSIAGLAGAFLGLADLQQADFFIKRALLVAIASGNAFELATCKLQEASIESAVGNHVAAIATATEAAELFETMDSRTSRCVATYRRALCQFRAGQRQNAQETLRQLDALLTDAWMTGVLIPDVREHPMFAQWAASRGLAGQAFREMIERMPFRAPDAESLDNPQSRFPQVVAKSLGHVSVAVGGREVTEEAWASLRAKELFFLFLANRSGLRKEEAVEQLYPELPREKCNSAFHSNLYRLRRALYAESVVKRDGEYVLNPEGTFTWDVDEFEGALARASNLPDGSSERATSYQEAVSLYGGPFAGAFYSEWAASIRHQMEERSHSALAALAGYYAGRGDYEAAARCMERVLQGNRFNEEAAYSLAAYRSQAGQPVAALALLDDYRSTYEAEFGERLPERFLRLRASIAAGAGA